MNKNTTLRYFENKRLIAVIERLSMQGADPAMFRPLLGDLLDGTMLRGTHALNAHLYRGRNNEHGRLFESVDELKYPKSEFVKFKGRLNDVNESVLYAALCELGTIIEMDVSVNRIFTISKIERLKDSRMYFLPLGFLPKLSQFFSGMPPSNKADNLVHDFIKNKITRRRVDFDDYNCTIALGEMFLRKPVANYDASPLLGVAYPSVRSAIVSNTTTYNLAMAPEAFDLNYRIRECFVYVLTYEVHHYQLNPVNRGQIASSGEIRWMFTHSEMVERASQGLWTDDYFNPHLAASTADM